jgi:hypothetical protein
MIVDVDEFEHGNVLMLMAAILVAGSDGTYDLEGAVAAAFTLRRIIDATLRKELYKGIK